MLNPDDYDNDGNNIVPCPICLNKHCISKEGGKCPDEDEFFNNIDRDTNLNTLHTLEEPQI